MQILNDMITNKHNLMAVWSRYIYVKSSFLWKRVGVSRKQKG